MNENEVLQEFVAEVDSNYTASNGGKSMATVGLDPISIITAILAILAQLCPKPPAALKASATSRDLGTLLAARTATRQALAEEHPGVPFAFAKYNGKAIADAVLASVAAKDEAKIQVGLACVCK